MKKRCLKLMVATALFAIGIFTTNGAYAQNSYTQSSEPKASTEFGLGAGIRYNWLKVHPISAKFTPDIAMDFSYGAALQFRLNIGKTFGIQPEISYAYSTIRINDKTNKFSTKAKFNMVQIPMLLSFKMSVFRINFGPVFTLMDNPTYQIANNDTITTMPLGKIFPSITYTAGFSFKFKNGVMFDLRYADQFKNIKSENSYIWSLDKSAQSEAQTFRTSSRSVQFRFGYVF